MWKLLCEIMKVFYIIDLWHCLLCERFNWIKLSLFLANDDQVDKAKEIIKKLHFPFQSESFENPVLQKHYVNMEAMALNRDDVEDVNDFTGIPGL